MQDLRHHPKLRAATLVVASVVVASRGAAYINPPTTGLTTFVDLLVPLKVWAIVWFAVALMLLGGLWSRAVARAAMSFGGGLWTIWGISYMWATFTGGSARGWTTAFLFFGLAGFMWILATLIEVLRHQPPVDKQ